MRAIVSYRIIVLVIVIWTLLAVEGFSLHKYHSYRKNLRDGRKIPKHVTISQNNPVNICPPVVCPEVHIPEKCRKETFTNVYGIICRGCDQNICDDNFERSKFGVDKGHIRGDIPKVPKFLNNLNVPSNWNNLERPIATKSNPVNIPWNGNYQRGPNNIYWQNNLPVWQNDIPSNPRWQNNVPVDAHWQDNVPFNAQWQNSIPTNAQWQDNIPVNIQWQNNAPTATPWQNSVSVNNQWLNAAPINTQLQNNAPVYFPAQNQWQTGQANTIQTGPTTNGLGTVAQGMIGTTQGLQTNQWERGPFLPVGVNTGNFQNLRSIPQAQSSLPVFKGDGNNIGTPITGLPIQITGKAVNSVPVRVESDQNLGFTDPLYNALSVVNLIEEVRKNVYDANAPSGKQSVIILPASGKK